VELVEAKARGYIPIAAGSPIVNTTTASGSLGSFWDSSSHASAKNGVAQGAAHSQQVHSRGGDHFTLP